MADIAKKDYGSDPIMWADYRTPSSEYTGRSLGLRGIAEGSVDDPSVTQLSGMLGAAGRQQLGAARSADMASGAARGRLGRGAQQQTRLMAPGMVDALRAQTQQAAQQQHLGRVGHQRGERQRQMEMRRSAEMAGVLGQERALIDEETGSWAGAGAGAMQGAAAGSTFGPWGAAIGGIAGGLFGYFAEEGGVVPGDKDEAVPVIAHGGEVILPEDVSKKLLKALSSKELKGKKKAPKERGYAGGITGPENLGVRTTQYSYPSDVIGYKDDNPRFEMPWEVGFDRPPPANEYYYTPDEPAAWWPDDDYNNRIGTGTRGGYRQALYRDKWPMKYGWEEDWEKPKHLRKSEIARKEKEALEILRDRLQPPPSLDRANVVYAEDVKDQYPSWVEHPSRYQDMPMRHRDEPPWTKEDRMKEWSKGHLPIRYSYLHDDWVTGRGLVPELYVPEQSIENKGRKRPQNRYSKRDRHDTSIPSGPDAFSGYQYGPRGIRDVREYPEAYGMTQREADEERRTKALSDLDKRLSRDDELIRQAVDSARGTR